MEKTPKNAQFNMQAHASDEIDLSNDSVLLDSMLAEMAEDDSILAEGHGTTAVESRAEVALADDSTIAGVIADIEKGEAAQAIYADQKSGADLVDGIAPLTAADAVEKTKKEKKVKAAKVAKAPKEAKAPRVSFVGNKRSEVLTARVGGDKGVILLEANDVSLSAEDLKAKQEALMSLLDSHVNHAGGASDGPTTQIKVALKIIRLLDWVKNGGKVNEVMRRVAKVLSRDGLITTGDRGNLFIELSAKPYSPATCRAQVGQMTQMLPMLKMATLTSKGTLTANPDSLILMKMKAELDLSL